MPEVLVAVKDEDIAKEIMNTLPEIWLKDHTAHASGVFPKFQERNLDMLFIDLDIANELDISDPQKNFYRTCHRLYPLTPIVVVSDKANLRKLVGAVKKGASDYLTLPVILDEVKMVAENLSTSIIDQTELDYLRDRFWKMDSRDKLRTKSEKLKKVFDKIRSVAPTTATVLLLGETGCGKGFMAKLIHHHSNRSENRFFSVHCGAIPDTLIESELFGHEKGSFTGATRKKLGKFELADQGTIFLDEIGTISPAAQVKLLEVLQDNTFCRIGGEEPVHTNARIIAATNANLKKMVDSGEFRSDLYYRLNVFPIEIPPLRDRAEDIPYFSEFFLSSLNQKYQKKIEGIHPSVIESLKNYAWPGNIRELENLIERAVILEKGTTLMPDSFPAELMDSVILKESIVVQSKLTLTEARKRVVEEFEIKYLNDLLLRNKGKVKLSSTDAGIGVRQLHKLLQKYGILKEKFKNVLSELEG